MPYRAPGSPGHSRQTSLSGKPIRYYRPKGSPEIRHLIDDGFQAFNAGRLSEACQIFAEKMLAPENDTTIGLTIAGAHDAGRPRRLRHRDDGPRPGRLHHLDRREPLSRPALRAEFHAAPRLAVRQRRRAVRGRRHPDLRRAVSGDRAARNRRLHPRLHRPLGPERAGRDLGVPLPARPRSARAVSRLRGALGRRARRARPACRSTPRRPATARSA